MLRGDIINKARKSLHERKTRKRFDKSPILDEDGEDGKIKKQVKISFERVRSVPPN